MAQVNSRQEELAQALDAGAGALAQYLRQELDLEQTSLTELPALPRQLAPEEAFHPPIGLEVTLYGAWESVISRQRASYPAFWTICHIRWLEEGLLGDDPDACFSTGVPGKKESSLDNRARDLLRRLGGLPIARGSVSVFSDCPLARAWWKRNLALQASQHAPGLTIDAAHQALHRSNQIYEELVRLSVRRITSINHPRTRAAIVAHIASVENIKREEVQAIAQALARQGLTYSLDLLPWDDLLSTVRNAA